jgi:hypothetical protein
MSQYPYDQNLFEHVRVTRADKQEGYDVTILDPHPRRGLQPHLQPGLVQPQHPQRAHPRHTSSHQSAPPSFEQVDYYHSQPSPLQPKPRKPWYRSTVFVLLIVLLALVGATVGIVFAVKNNARANSSPSQQGALAPTSAEKGSEGVNTTDPNALPTLPSLSVVRLDTPTPAAAAVAATDRVITPNANRGAAASAVVQSPPRHPRK